MQTLADIFADSFAIWSRNFALMYVFLFFSLLIIGIWPESETPSWEPRWILLVSVMILLSAAFMAGWFNMISAACQRYFAAQKGKPMDIGVTIDAFKLFREFLPGIGRFFTDFAIGTLLQAAVAGGIIYAVYSQLDGNLGLYDKLTQVPVAERDTYLQNLPLADKNALARMSVAVMGGIAVFSGYLLLTMFWQAYVVLYHHNAFKAVWMSVRQFFRDPLRVLGMGLFFLLAQLLLTLVMSMSPVSFVVGQFFVLMLEIYMAVVLFVYVLTVSGRPALNEGAVTNDTPEPADDATGSS